MLHFPSKLFFSPRKNFTKKRLRTLTATGFSADDLYTPNITLV